MVGVAPPRTRFAATLWADHAETLRHHISQVSLIHGWAPLTVQAISAVVLACAVGWRTRRWRRISLALLVGVGLAVYAHCYIGSVGVAGDPAPSALWIWIGLTGLAAGVLVPGWPGARWWLRGVSVLASGLPPNSRTIVCSLSPELGRTSPAISTNATPSPVSSIQTASQPKGRGTGK
jgi:hypothetical protein